MTIEFIWQFLGTTLLLGACLWALWRGEAPERWGGAILLVGFLMTEVVELTRPRESFEVPAFVVVDIITLIGFVVLSLRSRRIWTLFISAFQLNAIISHFAVQLSSHVDMYTQITAVGLWGGYGLSLALIAGMWILEWRRWQTRRTTP
ncbi:MAG: hypothetical protein QM647_14645 [Asticcacaulis sp.]|uniref:hypothetical protein n=1 Tax=Asticcacaulis sp. TaxID=1872648 RepID=UPI0039E26101